jgi:hypothetical protein
MSVERKFKEVEKKKLEFFDALSSARQMAPVEEPMVMRSTAHQVSQPVFTKPQDITNAAPFSEISSVQSNKHKRMMSVPKFDVNASKASIGD